MKLTKDEVNNAIVAILTNVRPHSNADRLQLATVLGNTTVVGLDAEEGDKVVYFDSNLALSTKYMHFNNLHSSSELNQDGKTRGYFGKNGKVKAQKFRGEVSNGYVADCSSLYSYATRELIDGLKVGDEFTHINDHLVASKYVTPLEAKHGHNKAYNGLKRTNSHMFVQHWQTKHFMRNKSDIQPGQIFIEEKIHGTSGRTANCLVERKLSLAEKVAKFLGCKIETQEWRILNGSRRVVLTTDRKREVRSSVRDAIVDKIGPHILKGEQLYYEIAGFDLGSPIQGGFPYGCKPGEHKVFLYRVTQNTPDGRIIDMPRKYVYKRADELGLLRPPLLQPVCFTGNMSELQSIIETFSNNKYSYVDKNTILEGVVIWFRNEEGLWKCLKHKSEAFLLRESKARDKGVIDPEDEQ